MESVLNSYHPPIDWSEGTISEASLKSAGKTNSFWVDEAGFPLSPRSPSQTNPQIPESKRDKKRREISDRLTNLNTEFLLSREQNFRATLQKLQAELAALHEGGNREFLDRVEILEDARDKELVQIEAGRGYALLRAEREYQDEMRRAEEEYIAQKRAAKENLLHELMTKRKRLESDKELLDVASDGTLLMHHATSLVVPLSPSSHTHDRRKLRTHTSRRHPNGLGIHGFDDILPAAKRVKKDGQGNGNGSGGYDSEQPFGSSRVRKEDSRDKVMNTFKVADEKNMVDILEIRKAIGVTRAGKLNNKRR